MRRAVLSLGTNLAEGFGRRSPRDKAHFYTISFGSGEELKHCVLVSRGLKYITNFDELWPPLESISGMLRNLINAVLEDDA